MTKFKKKSDYDAEVVEIANLLKAEERQELFAHWRDNQMSKNQWGVFEGYRSLAHQRRSQKG